MRSDVSPYATLAVVREHRAYRFIFAGYSAGNARTVPTVRMLRSLLADVFGQAGSARHTAFVQYDDYAHHDIPSVAFGRWSTNPASVALIPDTYFYESRGYDQTRQAATAGRLPDWQDRRDMVFWRGSPTTNYRRADGGEVTSIEEIPRVALCHALRGDTRCDVAVSRAWGRKFSEAEMVAQFQAAGIYRPGIPMLQHAQYKYLIDIDGVANAWSLFDKLLMGCCILKIDSPFEQWYYDRLLRWVHYVPVARDLSDLHHAIDWCVSHEADARRIATQAQQLALSYTFEMACEAARAMIERCMLPV